MGKNWLTRPLFRSGIGYKNKTRYPTCIPKPPYIFLKKILSLIIIQPTLPKPEKNTLEANPPQSAAHLILFNIHPKPLLLPYVCCHHRHAAGNRIRYFAPVRCPALCFYLGSNMCFHLSSSICYFVLHHASTLRAALVHHCHRLKDDEGCPVQPREEWRRLPLFRCKKPLLVLSFPQ